MDSEEEKKREALGKQIVCDLLEIAELTQQPIKEMRLNTHGVFEEVKNPKNEWKEASNKLNNKK